ncbi:hypothetical protein [Ktedonobacter sp. SOSP1-85]|uniref:hypothetical protein n=1 Tax=Ktedonobacter sp. SOSP1-85 TaxID=2778367 RepID=UPI0019166496|nr:hypothetical protein [Ktedonobacter sp. SOSP1-85]
MMTNVQDRGGNWCGPGLGSPGPERKEPFSAEGVGGAGADCVEGMGSSHVRESWACTELGVLQRCGFRRHWGIVHSHFSSGGVIGRRPSHQRRGDRALLGSG